MQEYGGVGPNKPADYRDAAESARERSHQGDAIGYHHLVMQQKGYACLTKDLNDQNVATYCRVVTGIYESSSSNQQCQNPRFNSSAPSFSSPPNSPLVGLVFDPSSPNSTGIGMMGERGLNPDRRASSSWSISNQEPIGTGAKKKIVKSHDKRGAYSADPRSHQDRYKDAATEIDKQRKERNLTSESTSSLDFYMEGERMVSELCNIESNSRNDNAQKRHIKSCNHDDDKNKASGSSDVLLTALDKLVIHDQIPNQIVQLAIEACTDAENIAIAHHNRPCFKNIHSICAKTRSNVQKPDSAVANLHSQGIPWVIKNFIFSFVRILDGWKGVKELLSEKHDTFSRIENKYYSPDIRECFVQWQAVTKEMLSHIYKTFKCLDHGFTMEQKSFTHNYYATNSAAPRHQNQNKFLPPKPHPSTPRPVNASPQTYNSVPPPWVQNQGQSTSQTFSDSPWPIRSGVPCKKFPIVPPQSSHNFYPLNDQSEMDSFQKVQYKCDPYNMREAKPRQSWTITNVPDFRSLEGMCHAEKRELYSQLKHKMDAELGKAPGQPIMPNISSDLLQRREMELKAKMIPLSHVEKSLIPNIASAADIRGCYVQKNNSCGDTKEDNDFFAAWGQMVQKEPSDFLTHHAHNVQIPTNIVTLSNNISGPVQFIDPENDEFHEMSKVYMKPGSYKVPIKPADTITPFLQGTSQEVVYDNPVDELSSLKIKVPFQPVTLAPQPKYNLESWPCMMSRRTDDLFSDDHKMMARPSMPCLDIMGNDPLELLSSMTSDRAWEAAKQSAPKLMDFIHEGSKSDTARLYNALGLSASEEFSEDMKQMKMGIEQCGWPTDLTSNNVPKEVPDMWDQVSCKHDYLLQDPAMFCEDATKLFDAGLKSPDSYEQNISDESKLEDESKENSRYPNFDQTGNYVRDETQKKSSGKPKIVAPGMWYHPKKKKPLAAAVVKKFDNILANLSQLNEANFIQHDMDIKMAPRFYEVVKYPMCLNDIATKLKNSSYTEQDQVIQDFRRIFNNVKLYLKNYPDPVMKMSVSKVSVEFEKMLTEELQNKWDQKKELECQENGDERKRYDKVEGNKVVDDLKRADTKNANPDDKK